MANLFKKIGLGFLGFVVLLVAVSFVLPSKVSVSRSAVINAPVPAAYEQVNTLKKWEDWSPWHQMDSTMQLTYEGPAAGTGAKYSWVSEGMGNGSLLITNAIPNQSIETDLNFGEMGVSKAKYTFEPVAEGTKVTWSMDSDGTGMAWYWAVPSRYMNLLMPGMLEADFDKGLHNLKQILENNPKQPASPETASL